MQLMDLGRKLMGGMLELLEIQDVLAFIQEKQ